MLRRARNRNQCEWCPSRDLAEDSVLCRECQELEDLEAEQCDHDCGRSVRLGRGTCHFCLEAEEITRRGDELLKELLEGDGCLRCGEPGYDGEQCSRDCMNEN